MNKNLDGSNRTFAQDLQITFKKEGHIYTHTPSGKQFESVSQVVSHYFKPFDSEYWAQRKAPSMGISAEELMDRWEANRDEASFTGTHMHAQIEAFYNNLPMTPYCVFSYRSAFQRIDRDINISKELDYFNRFAKKNPLKPFRTEWIIFNETLQIAGTIDLVACNDDGTYDIYDWKRSKSLINNFGSVIKCDNYGACGINGMDDVPDVSYWHYVLQQNLYRNILQSCYDIKVKNMHLVVIHPNYNTYHIIDVPERSDLINRIIYDRKNAL